MKNTIMESTQEELDTHILAIPFPAQGHLNPMVQLCKRLVSKGNIRVTLVTTASISKSLLQIQADSSSNNLNINIETVPDKSAAAREDLNFYDNVVQSFKASMSAGLQDIIQKYNSSSCLKAVVYDSIIPWTLDIAHGNGLKGAVLFTQPCTVCSVYYHLYKGKLEIPHDDDDDDFEVLLPGMPLVFKLQDLPSLVYDKNYASMLRLCVDQFSTFQKADWRLFNTFDKLEDEILKWTASQYSLLTIGPTVPSMYTDKRIPDNYGYCLSFFEPSTDSCMKWLDTKEDHSVIYLSFGSLVDFGEKQMEELARGLINSGYNFLWIVKDPKMSKLAEDIIISSVIPPEKGLIVKWCNQLEILSHRAVGCFITHCGWNSTMEALCLGVPMVAMPHWTDQTTNAKLIVDVWKVGVRVKTGGQDGIVDREEIARHVKDVMEGERGDEIRRNAAYLKCLAVESVSEGGNSDKNITDFVKQLLVSN